MKTITQYATSERLLYFIAKERVKHCRRHESEQYPKRDALTDFLPARYTWVRARRRSRFVQKNGDKDTKRANVHAIQLTVKRDRKCQQQGLAEYPYLKNLDAYIERLQQTIFNGEVHFHAPVTQAKPKKKIVEDGQTIQIYRPLTVYTDLDDKIILSLTGRYLAQVLNNHLHKNILSYRMARPFMDQRYRVTDYNDGILLINQFREAHPNQSIYASDCDIKKFFDYLDHDVAHHCMQDALSATGMAAEELQRVMKIIDAYLQSYNFQDHVLNVPHAANIHYESIPDIDASNRGIPQGGALSNIIANVVLNHVDQQVINDHNGDEYLFIRFCDDMILLHTDKEACQQMMSQYVKVLQDHQLVYHDFVQVRDYKDGAKTLSSFWDQKSHAPYVWDKGDGDSNAFVGFLGYEMNREGEVRLRSSNMDKYKKRLQNVYFSIHRMYKRNRLTDAQKESIVRRRLDRLSKTLLFYTSLSVLPPYPPQELERRQKFSRMVRRLKVFLRSQHKSFPQ